MQDFRRLEVWHTAMALTRATYESVKSLPNDERFGLTAQIRKSAVSIPSNIAEGCGRNSRKELIYFVGVAMGSLCELETQIELANDLYQIPEIGQLFERLHATRAKLLRFRAAVYSQLPSD